MKLIERNGLRILEASPGYWIYNKNDVNPSYTETIYLGKKDSKENYKEISKDAVVLDE